MFYSRRCKVCNHLKKPLAAIEKEQEGWLSIARLCTDEEETWALEVRALSSPLFFDTTSITRFVCLLTKLWCSCCGMRLTTSPASCC